MDQEKDTLAKKSSPKWLWILVVLIILVIAFVVWFVTRDKKSDEESATTNKNETVVTAKHASDWQLFTSKKYGFKMYYPKDYTLTESATGTIKLNKAAVEMVDMYVYSANGDESGMLKSQSALYTDDTKGYMTGGVETTLTVAGESAKKATGTFGKNAGVSQTHAGVKGSSVYFTRDDKLFIYSSYDNGDTAAITIFNDIMADLSF